MRLAWWLRSYWFVHSILGLITLLSTMPILWSWLAESQLYTLGYIIASCIGISTLWLIISLVIEALLLRNSKLIIRLLSWLALWLGYGVVFSLLAYAAELKPSSAHGSTSAEQETTVHLPEEKLMGVSSLQLYYDTKGSASQLIAHAPHLSKLAKHSPHLLDDFFSQSNRWKHHMNDQFYAELGHVVLTNRNDPSGTHGSVHATFRRLVEGENIPEGYIVMQSGKPFPSEALFETFLSGDIPDIALDLGGNYLLLLAWRGLPNTISAHRALNAAIKTIDAQFETLANAPNDETLEQVLYPAENLRGNTAEIRLNSPPSQYGCYQAEVYANPAQKGYMSLIARDVATGKQLININFRSQYSYDDQELYRHEIPHSLHSWMLKEEWMPRGMGLLDNLPLFTIMQSDELRSFLVDMELWFSPYGNQSPERLLTKKRYRVQSYQPSSPKPKQSFLNLLSQSESIPISAPVRALEEMASPAEPRSVPPITPHASKELSPASAPSSAPTSPPDTSSTPSPHPQP